LGAVVVVDVPDVEPVFRDREGDDVAAGFDQAVDELGHVEAAFGAEVFECAWAEEIDASVDEMGVGGLFDQFAEILALGFDDSIGDIDFVGAHSEGEVGLMLGVETGHVSEVDAGEDVAVHNEDRALGFGDHAKSTGGSERGFFVDVVHFHAEVGSVAEVLFDDFGEKMGGDADAVDSRGGELAHDPLKQGAVTDREHWFGEVFGEGSEASAESASHDDGVDGRFIGQDELIEHDNIDDAEF